MTTMRIATGACTLQSVLLLRPQRFSNRSACRLHAENQTASGRVLASAAMGPLINNAAACGSIPQRLSEWAAIRALPSFPATPKKAGSCGRFAANRASKPCPPNRHGLPAREIDLLAAGSIKACGSCHGSGGSVGQSGALVVQTARGETAARGARSVLE